VYLRADIELVPGQSEILKQCMNEFLVPLAVRAGWKLVVCLWEIEDDKKVTNIWDVGDAFDSGIELMQTDESYKKYEQLLAQCIANETHTLCESWRR